MARALRIAWLLLGLALTSSACSSVPPDLFSTPAPPGAGPHVQLHYLGNGGWLIQRGDDKIVTAPFVSNPHALTLLLPGGPNTARIDAVLPPMHDVKIILVGHGHYDHAMDLPYVHEKKAPAAQIYGSTTVVNTLAAVHRLAPYLTPITERQAASGDHPGEWLPSRTSKVRFMPLLSTHAPHFAGRKLIPWWSVDEKQTSLPCCPFWWKEGPTFAFLIDFLDKEGGAPQFRIYYQDAASRPRTGIVPVLTGPDAVKVDVAILCVAAFDQVDDNPEHILANVDPRHVIGGHWEDFFFQSYGARPPRPTFGTDLREFHRRASARVPTRAIYLPAPGDRLHIPVTVK